MIIRIPKDDGLTPFERHFLSQDISDKKQVCEMKRFLIPIDSLDKYFTEADDVAVDTNDERTGSNDVAVDNSEDEKTNENDENHEEDTEKNDEEPKDVATDDTEDDEENTENDNDENDDKESSDVATDDTEDDEDTEDNEEDTKEDNEEGNEEKGKDIIHKQNLYKKFMNIYDSLNHYIEKLENVVGINEECNREYKSINNKLKNLRDFIYHYMILKFPDASYGQSMLFYQRSIGTIQLAMELLENTKEKEATLRSDN